MYQKLHCKGMSQVCCRGYFRGCCWGFAECVEAGVAGVLQGVSIMIIRGGIAGVLQGCCRGYCMVYQI